MENPDKMHGGSEKNLLIQKQGLNRTIFLAVPDRKGQARGTKSMKTGIHHKLLSAFMAILVTLSFCSGVFAEEQSFFVKNKWNYVDGSMDISAGIPGTANGVLARIKENGVLRVGVEPYFPPQEFIDPALKGEAAYVGADMELAKLIAARMGVALKIIPMEFTDLFRAVNRDQCDLLISALSFTPARAASCEMSKGYFFTDAPANITMVIREGDAGTIRTVKDLEEKTLVAQRGSLQEAVTAENITKYKEFRRVAQTQEVYEAVRSGSADAGSIDMATAQDYIRNNPGCGLVLADGIRFKLEDQYGGDRIAAKNGELELMYFVNGVIDEVLEKGLYTKWYREAQKRADELGL